MALLAEITVPGHRANGEGQPNQKHNVGGKLESVLCDLAVTLHSPRRIGQDPIDPRLPIQKVPALTDLAPISLAFWRWWKIIVKSASASTGIKNQARNLKIPDDPLSQNWISVSCFWHSIPCLCAY